MQQRVKSTIVLTTDQWLQIYNKLAKEYSYSYLLIRSKMKSELGFTTRNHTKWIDVINSNGDKRANRIEEIHLDFYNESAQTFFVLKYLNT